MAMEKQGYDDAYRLAYLDCHPHGNAVDSAMGSHEAIQYRMHSRSMEHYKQWALVHCMPDCLAEVDPAVGSPSDGIQAPKMCH